MPFAIRRTTGTIVAGATNEAAVSPLTICVPFMGNTANCWGSRFSSRGKMITGSVIHARKKKRADHPRYCSSAAGLEPAEGEGGAA